MTSFFEKVYKDWNFYWIFFEIFSFVKCHLDIYLRLIKFLMCKRTYTNLIKAIFESDTYKT